MTNLETDSLDNTVTSTTNDSVHTSLGKHSDEYASQDGVATARGEASLHPVESSQSPKEAAGTTGRFKHYEKYVNAWKAEIKSGADLYDMEEKYSVPEQTIRRVLAHHGHKISELRPADFYQHRGGKFTDWDKKEEIEKELNAGLTVKGLAERYGLKERRITQILREMGISAHRKQKNIKKLTSEPDPVANKIKSKDWKNGKFEIISTCKIIGTRINDAGQTITLCEPGYAEGAEPQKNIREVL